MRMTLAGYMDMKKASFQVWWPEAGEPHRHACAVRQAGKVGLIVVTGGTLGRLG